MDTALDPKLYYRISDLPVAGDITGDEIVEAIQDGKNVKFTLSQLFVAGDSAYDIATEHGFIGTPEQWLASLVGMSAYDVARANGYTGTEADWLVTLIGQAGNDGDDGKSAFELAQAGGFQGTQIEWLASLKAKDGKDAFVQAQEAGFVGSLPDWLASLKGKDAYEQALEGGYIGSEEEWIASLNGTNGKSAFELVQEQGFEGSLDEWLKSLVGKSALEILANDYPEIVDAASLAAFLKGVKGDKGEKGDAGIGTRVSGRFDSVEELPDPVEAETLQQAYIVGKHLYVAVAGAWEDMGDLSGPEGMGLRIKGSLPNTDVLPTENNLAGDTYVINRAMWVWDETDWVEVGQPGPTGMSAFQHAQSEGFEGTLVMWLASLKGEKGERGDKGEKGEKGEAADALHLKGILGDIAELPVDAVLSDAYVVNNHVHAFTATGWKDLGRFDGESAFEVAQSQGYEGTAAEWLESLKGTNGKDGTNGKSAFEAAQAKGFVGTEAQWLDSLHGRNLQIDGVAASVEELPAAPIDETVVTYMVGDVLYVGTMGAWSSAGAIRGKDGTNGLSAVEQIGAVHPQVTDAASLAEFLKGKDGIDGDKGDQGDKGDKGEAGPALNVRGVFETEEEVLTLPEPQSGDFAVAGRYHYVYNGTVWGKTITMDGRNGDDGKNGLSAFATAQAGGFTGTEAQWLASLKGKDGTNGKDGLGIMVKDELASTADLPPEATIGEAYIIEGNIYMFGERGWFDGGPLRGEKGQDAYELAAELGYIGSPTEWIEHITGTDGKSAFELAKEANPDLVDEPTWLASLVGPQGPAGPMGPGVQIIGKLDSIAELPVDTSTYEPGDGYLIDGHFWGLAENSWVDCGLIQGPIGERGPQGIQGVKGNTGVKGERGSSLIMLDRDPGALDGAVTDVAMNTTTQGVWLKTSSTVWTFLGNFGGGNVYSPNNDGKQYVRVGNQWKEFNHYDLVATDTTGAIDISTGNVFRIDNSANSPKTIQLLKPPAGRATTVVILVKGKAGAVTWPDATVVTWGDSVVPELGDKITTVVLLWDGTQFVGSVGAKA